MLDRVRDGRGRGRAVGELGTDWLLLDAEVLPWSAKAEPLIREQYASVAAAAGAALPAAHVGAVGGRAARHRRGASCAARFAGRMSSIEAFTDVYRRYCWPTDGLDGLRLAPFHVLAGEGASLSAPGPRMAPGAGGPAGRGRPGAVRHDPAAGGRPGVTPDVAAATRLVAGADRRPAGRAWCSSRPSTPGPRVQPALKCRGREYLRIIYGPDYLSRLDPLRGRGLQRKRNLALREQGLGLAALDLLAAGGAGRAVHQLVFAVLACESEPVDPRL